MVSIFEYVFTQTEDVAHQVAHFERFPQIGPTQLTPDFSVLTTSSRGIVGEIARIARRPTVLTRSAHNYRNTRNSIASEYQQVL